MTSRQSPKRSLPVHPDFGRFAGLGLRFALTIALFGLVGWWADARLGWSPWLMVVGILLGSVVSFVSIVRAVGPAHNLDLPPLTDADFADTDLAHDTHLDLPDPDDRQRAERPPAEHRDPRSR